MYLYKIKWRIINNLNIEFKYIPSFFYSSPSSHPCLSSHSSSPSCHSCSSRHSCSCPHLRFRRCPNSAGYWGPYEVFFFQSLCHANPTINSKIYSYNISDKYTFILAGSSTKSSLTSRKHTWALMRSYRDFSCGFLAGHRHESRIFKKFPSTSAEKILNHEDIHIRKHIYYVNKYI